ncbi:MAG: arylsulfatase [Odoribacter sp.]
MKTTHLLLSLTALAGVIPVVGNAQTKVKNKDKKPNIIYILADDLGRAELGSYGQQLIETPNLDALAKSGMTFTNHYSGTAVSAPSRCILFTGMHSGHSYIRGNDEGEERGKVWDFAAVCADSTLEGQRPVPANTIMIPRAIKAGGYTTACVGKWGLGFPGSVSTPNKMGFDFFYGYNCQRQSHTYFPTFLYRNEAREYIKNDLVVPGTKLDKDADPMELKSYAKYTRQTYSPDLMYDELIRFIDRSKDKPFALFWTTPVPHVPLQAPERWVKYYVDKFGDETPYDGKQGYFPCRYPHATYAAMVSYWDEQIGGLIAELKKLGIYENTIIMFTSDNGPTFNGGSDSPWFDSAKPFKSERNWGKGSLREGGIRTPLIVSWPKKVKAGASCDVISAFWDMMPTFCEIAGVPSPKTDGISLLPSILGETQQKQHDHLYWEYCEAGGEKAVRMGKWKGYLQKILNGNREIELYDLSLDPREQTNVAKYHPEVVTKIKEIMKKEHIDAELKSFNMPE